ncbi:MAG: HAMP domain-containing histidine kinase [Bacteroidetes bacterium]|nr:HAMP domain-containing histidine kinase [Bacteroidota bacterium]
MDSSNEIEDLQQANATLSENIQKLGSEMELVQQRFEQQSKLAGIGQLTAGILHEIRNPLNFVNNFSRLTLDLVTEMKELLNASESTETEEVLELVDMVNVNINRILENGSRAERIVQTMLTQTRTDANQVIPTDLNQLLEEFSKLAYQGVRGNDKEFNVKFIFRLDPGIGKVNLMASEFTRVIINLVNNACYAVNARSKEQNEPGYVPEIMVSSALNGDWVDIRIRDNGIGISQDTVEKVFNPFFTTKPPGEGTGLGLSLSMATINEMHKGKLTVTSEKGVFTEFVISIPLNL